MNIKEESGAYKLLCNACLCVGRKLHTITNEKTYKYYIDALDQIPVRFFSMSGSLNIIIYLLSTSKLVQTFWHLL